MIYDKIHVDVDIGSIFPFAFSELEAMSSAACTQTDFLQFVGSRHPMLKHISFNCYTRVAEPL